MDYDVDRSCNSIRANYFDGFFGSERFEGGHNGICLLICRLLSKCTLMVHFVNCTLTFWDANLRGGIDYKCAESPQICYLLIARIVCNLLDECGVWHI